MKAARSISQPYRSARLPRGQNGRSKGAQGRFEAFNHYLARSHEAVCITGKEGDEGVGEVGEWCEMSKVRPCNPKLLVRTSSICSLDPSFPSLQSLPRIISIVQSVLIGEMAGGVNGNMVYFFHVYAIHNRRPCLCGDQGVLWIRSASIPVFTLCYHCLRCFEEEVTL